MPALIGVVTAQRVLFFIGGNPIYNNVLYLSLFRCRLWFNCNSFSLVHTNTLKFLSIAIFSNITLMISLSLSYLVSRFSQVSDYVGQWPSYYY